MHCGACGARLRETDRFCTACGRTVEAAVEPAARDTRTSPDTAIHLSQLVTAAPSGRAPSSSSGWLTASDSIDHGRFAPGSVFEDRYRIIGLLGRGGMGEVYRADDLRLGQPVALKFLPENLRDDPVRLAQFHNEVRTARQVSHPNICRVYDIGEAAGHLYLTMEYVDGEDLATSLRRIGRFPEDKAVEIARQLCAGVAAAHERGVLHRDLKPANVMLDGAGKVRVMDFGLAAVGPVADVRAGTPAYMAPEQLLGREVTARSDIFALGLVLYELFTGRRAFSATTVGELVNQHESRSTPPPSSLVSTLDPAIERAILRCLEPDPARRPSSALAVAAALPGGDPLAAALAAGETPSPEMVAAAGEGVGLAPRVALPLLLAVLVGTAAAFALVTQMNPLERIRPRYATEVLSQKARDAIRTIGYTDNARDEAYGFQWDGDLIDHVTASDKPAPDWDVVLTQRPSPLIFWYRQSPSPLASSMFHHDLLTPGIVDQDDPPPIVSGMRRLQLDHEGRLRYFEAVPPQREDQAGQTPEPRGSGQPDWSPLFALAGLEQTKLTPAEPLWNWLAASDARAAWTGTWPESGRPLRVEAAALRGRPVAFMLTGPWTKPWRMDEPSMGRQTAFVIVVFAFALALLVGGALLARRHLREGRGDVRGAFRFACFMTGLLLVLWACQVHLVAGLSLFAMFLIAVCTSVFYGVFVWTTYVALEPVVRRRWPQTLVSLTTLLSGRARDAVVGRDVLVGIAIGVSFALLISAVRIWTGEDAMSSAGSMDMLASARGAVADLLMTIAYAVRSSLLIFFGLFLFKTLLRKQWATGLAFATAFALLEALGSKFPLIDGLTAFVYFGITAVAVLRWGFTSLVLAFVTTNLLLNLPATQDLSAWYAGTVLGVIGAVLAVAIWAFRTSLTARLWRKDLFS